MRLVTGRPHRLLSRVADEIGALIAGGKPCMLLVPAQYTLQAEVELMDRLRIEGSFLIDVLSPKRLQSRVFERAGYPQRVILDERGRRMVMCALIEQEKANLTVYAGAAGDGAGGLAERVLSLIADFKRSGRNASDVLACAKTMEKTSTTRAKLLDVAHLYAAYEQRMQGKLADAEDVLSAMFERLDRSQVVRDQHVFVYGFDMVTPQFAQELLTIDPLCDALTLYMETDRSDAPDARLFSAVNDSLLRLREKALSCGVPFVHTHVSAPLDAPEDIRAMESGLFALNAKPYEEPAEHIELRTASTKRVEVHLAAAKMRTLIMEGADSADMAVVYPKGSGYAALLSGILPQYGISAYIAEKRPAHAHPLCRFLLGAIASVTHGWRTADVVECAQSGFLPLTRGETDSLCAYIEDFGVRADAIRKPFSYIKGDDEQALRALNAAREKLVGPLEALLASLLRAKDADDVISAAIELLDRVGAYETLCAMREELSAAGLTGEAEDCAQIWNALMDTLDQLHELLGSEQSGGKRGNALGRLALQMLSDGLQALELSALPPADGAVICGEIGNVRTAQMGTLFALGMNDQGAQTDVSLLTPLERREAIDASGAYLGMSPDERASLSELDELKSLSGTRGKLYVSMSVADETGRALREGTAMQALRRLFPKLIVCGGIATKEQSELLAAPSVALQALCTHLSDVADGKLALEPMFVQAYAALREHDEEALRVALFALTRPMELRLTPERANKLYGRPVMSVSRLETFAQCPYKHFMRYGLSASQAPRPGVDRAELGTLYHEAARRFTLAAAALPSFPRLDAQTVERMMDDAVMPLIERWRASPLGQSARGGAYARRIARTAGRAARSILSQFSGGSFRPLFVEMAFGRDGEAPIEIPYHEGSSAYLQGRIDRVDVYGEQGQAIRVIDYKSGVQKFDPTMAYWGIQIQLLIYLAEALRRLPGSRAAGLYYSRIADPTIKTESRDREEIDKQIEKKLSLSGISLSDANLLRAQGGAQAAMLGKNGEPSGRYSASLADEETMNAMVCFALHKAAQLAGEAYAGNIDDSPARYGQYFACNGCEAADVCGFDPTVRRPRQLVKKTKEDLR